MTSNHTPGPWYATDNGRDPPFVTDAHGDEILASWENARLIAAAPELLNLLGYALIRLEMDNPATDPLLTGIRAAIAKARGEN